MNPPIEIPEKLLEHVNSKGKHEEFGVPTVAELYQAWVDGAVTLPRRKPKPSPLSREELEQQGREWVKKFEELVDAFARMPVADSRTCSEIIMEDRNRLERKSNEPNP